MTTVIDWSALDRYRKNICYCRCGIVYDSHSKCTFVQDRFVTVTRENCPNCKRNIDNCYKIYSTPEKQDVR